MKAIPFLAGTCSFNMIIEIAMKSGRFDIEGTIP